MALGAEAKRRCVEMVEEAEEEVHDRSLVAESSFVQENHGFSWGFSWGFIGDFLVTS